MALFSKIVAFSFFLVSSLVSVHGDIYMHWPRGSNNRLNEASATRNNANRLFDSQNNERGGYNVGERVTGTTGADAVPIGDANFLNPNFPAVPSGTGQYQYQMVFFEDSILPVEWTHQHACGGNERDDPQTTNCDVVIQYMCEAEPSRVNSGGTPGNADYFSAYATPASRYPIGSDDAIIDGANTNTGSGVHESAFWYQFCNSRSRNNGLFLADQGMNGNTARFTRQDNAGTRYGNECPEERDYYPYWTPNPWIDVAILTDYSDSRCSAGKYTGASQNTNRKGVCDVTGANTGNLDEYRPWNKELCDSRYPGKWVEWELNWQAANLDAPDCLPAPWSRPNHLGNGRDGYMVSYNWTLPTISTLQALGMRIYRPGTGDANTLGGGGTTPTAYAKCVLRMRYNITTDEYNGDNVDGCYSGGNVNGNQNNNNQNLCSGANKKESPFTPRRPNNNANTYFADIGGLSYDNTDANNPAPRGSLRLAIDTSQFGRTFEDRSHTFIIKQRPPAFNGRKIYNLGVRGKRCNIVQCYPAVEYDFIPYHLSITQGDLIHVQWTGSNTHNNGGGGGDGQTGDAGQGTGGTDRHNMVEILDPSHNYPIPLDKYPNNLWSNSHCFSPFGFELGRPFSGTSTSTDGFNAAPGGAQWADISRNRNQLECALYMATSGYYRSLTQLSTNLAQFQPTLNNAPPSLIGGVVMEIFKKAGQTSTTYYYMSTRNNAFTNRSQKAKITVY